MRTLLHTFALGTALSLGLSTGVTLAQDASTPPPQGASAEQGMHHGHGPMTTEEQLAHMTKALSLTSDQQSQIKPLLDARREQMMQIHQDQSVSHEDKRTKMEALDNDTHTKVAAVLNDTQKAKFAKMQERREEHGEQHGDGNMGASQQPQ